MRAARVLRMLSVLQRRGRTTARELAETFEVSERTILRDVYALAEAGIPVYTSQGAGGGIELVDGFRTHLTGLTADEASTLFLTGQPRVAHRLGLAAPAMGARHKLLNAISPALADEADGLAGWFLNDPDPWTGNRIPHGELRRLARSIREQREVELAIGSEPPVAVRPVGLVLKAGSWHLVCTDGGRPTVLCVDRLRATRLTRQRFARPPDFDLTSFWDKYVGLGEPPTGAG